MTATIPGREKLLKQLRLSVESQTYPQSKIQHVVMLDENRDGCSVTTNRAMAKARGEWVVTIADDDLLLPGAIETWLEASEDADIVYGPPLVWGLKEQWWFYQAPPAIPSVALFRRSMWDELGGYNPDAMREEDRQLWVQALNAGKRFVRVSEPTWVYRFHGGNKSISDDKLYHRNAVV